MSQIREVIGRTASGLLYRCEGPEGAPAVLLSAGLGGLAAFFAPQRPVLAGRFRVLAFDHRGTGANRGPLPSPYSIGQMAEDALEVMEAAGLGRIHWLGHALGALVGLEVARRAPQRLASLLLVNAWAVLDRHTARCFDIRLDILAAQGPAAYLRAQPLFLHSAPYLSAQADAVEEELGRALAEFQGSEVLRARIAALRAFNIRNALAGIEVPALVLAARDDLLVPWIAGRALAEGLPRARFVLLEQGAHACTVEQAEACNRLILEFLQSLG
ncbi:MAG: pyrimidine utilization protein D [Rhodovarius sp.]|nr:pyrimidine utilization protein D [Rhodovarius sp.]MDW8315250.1 pyrimidine utilization protein D [Rhodovarius sp.]